MSDRFPGTISVGGTLPRSLLEAFVSALDEDGACWEEDGRAVTLDDLLARQGQTLRFFGDHLPYGEFRSTEAFCREHGLTYLRHSDAYCEIDAELVRWDSSMTEPVVVPADNNGNPTITLARLKKLLQSGSLDATISRLEAVIAPLPPFRVHD